MKKLFLLLAGGFTAFSANAQLAHRNPASAEGNPRKTFVTPATNSQNTAAPGVHSTNRTTSTACFTTEDFHSGTYTTLPTGWTAGIISGPGTWHWANTVSSSSFPIGTIASTTASNGWMIFDSDSLGGAVSTGPTPAGWLQSPAYNCSAYTSVRLTFQDYFRRFQDSCFVWVSTSPTFATYTSYPVNENNSIATNSSTANPTSVHMNISSVAASASAVYIRFVYYGPPGGGYSWMIDDLCLSPLNNDDVSISGSFMLQSEPASTSFEGSIFNTPEAFISTVSPIDSIYPITLLTNQGVSAETTIPMTAQIWEGTTSVYHVTSDYASLTGNASFPSTGFDSVVAFPGFYPPSVGNYTCAFSAPLLTDGDMTNNYDTLTFSVTDTTWMQNQGSISGGYYVRKPGTGGFSYFQGVRFDVPADAVGDTVTGFGVIFDSQSTPTGSGTVSVQLYSAQNTTSAAWNYVGSSIVKPLTGADISSATTDVWAYFASDVTGAGSWVPYILTPGTSYAAVIQINNVNTTLVVDATNPPNALPDYTGYFGQSDTSYNDGGTGFGHGTIATGFTAVPLVRMYFGNTNNSVGVTNVALNNQIGKAYPNPANTTVSIPFTLAQSGDVTVTLTNMIGQVVATQTIANTISDKATFNTTALSAGEYIYTVSANGQRTVGQVVVAH